MSCQFNAVDDKRVAILQHNLKNCTPTKWSLTGQENLHQLAYYQALLDKEK